MSLEAVKRNGHNLELGAFERAGEYGIPIIQPVHLTQRIEWMSFYPAVKGRNADRFRYGVHFFDHLFERVWNDTRRYMNFLSQFPAVLTPDFELYPMPVCLYNHWRKHQLGAYWQKWGLRVIPTIRWLDRASYSWCFDGEPEGGTVAVSSEGTDKDARKLFLDGYNEMLVRLQPEKILLFGVALDECKGNVEYHVRKDVSWAVEAAAGTAAVRPTRLA